MLKDTHNYDNNIHNYWCVTLTLAYDLRFQGHAN